MNYLKLFNVLMSCFTAGLFGYAVKPVIYSWNKSLGYGYADFISYVMVALMFVLLNIRIMDFSSSKKKEKSQ